MIGAITAHLRYSWRFRLVSVALMLRSYRLPLCRCRSGYKRAALPRLPSFAAPAKDASRLALRRKMPLRLKRGVISRLRPYRETSITQAEPKNRTSQAPAAPAETDLSLSTTPGKKPKLSQDMNSTKNRGKSMKLKRGILKRRSC